MKVKILCALTAFLLVKQAVAQKEPRLELFPLNKVRLLESPFERAQQTDLKYILALDPDRLLAPFFREAGLPSKAESYPNWERSGLDGHIAGHYLSALSLMYASTSNPELLKRLNYMVDQLAECQQKNGDGYIGGVPGGKAVWKEIAEGKTGGQNLLLHKKWVPWYNLHKTYAGLYDAYAIAGNQKAKNLLIKFSDWAIQVTANLSDDDFQKMLGSEHGGMNEVFADVARITGDKKYLELAKRFSHKIILDPLLKHEDKLNRLHANTQIPKVVGFAKVAQVSGDKSWENAADFFYKTVTEHRSVSIGGNSVREHFHPSNNFSSMVDSREGPETCNSYNMLKLAKELYISKGNSNYLDYYERTMYNHILSSQHPNGGFVYFTSMRPQHYRVYSTVDKGMWCCVGTGLENHAKYGELIYAHKSNDIYVNLYLPSVLSWKEKGLTLTQNTEIPYKETSKLTLQLSKPGSFSINFRKPAWLKDNTFTIAINGKQQQVTTTANGYVSLKRLWKSGDIITLNLPMETKTEFLPDNSPWVSFIHGPIVLAAATDTQGLTGLKADDSRGGHVANGPLLSIEDAPVLVSNSKDLVPDLVQEKPLVFNASKLIYQEKFKNLKLVPFYTIHDARYMVYWPVSSTEKIAERQQRLKNEENVKLGLETITIDQVAPGEQQPESDHNFQSENSGSGVFRDKHWRDARGWFSYDLKNPELKAKKLRVTYFGGDRNRNFDVFVNDILIKKVSLNASSPNQFIDVDYDLPQTVQESKKLILKFVADRGSVAGGVFYVKLLAE